MVCGCCKKKADDEETQLVNRHAPKDAAHGLSKMTKKEDQAAGPPAIATNYLPSTLDQTIFTTHGKGLIDFVLAYQPLEMDANKTIYRETFEDKLRNQGLYLEYEDLAQSQDGKTCFVKLHAPWETLARMAEVNRMKMPIQSNDIEDPEEMRTNECHYKFIKCCCCRKHPSDLEPQYFVPQEVAHFTLEFQRSRFRQYQIQDPNTFFTQADRIRIVWDILERTMIESDELKAQSGALLDTHIEGRQFGLNSMINEKVYVAAYPLHDADECIEVDGKKVKPTAMWPIRPWLYETWARFGRWRYFQPLDQVRKYFGEKVAMYFAWLGFYTRLLFPLTIVGMFCTIFGVYNMMNDPAVKDICTGALSKQILCRACPEPTCPFTYVNSACKDAKVAALFNNYSTLFFALFTSMWGVLFLEFWKRKEARLSCRWDTMDFDTEYEQTRPEYVVAAKSKRKNPVTLEWEPHIPPRSRAQSIVMSISFVGFMVTITLAVIASIIVYKAIMVVVYYNAHIGIIDATVGTAMFTNFTASMINAICIMVLEKIYGSIAWRLTEKEFPRTDSEFETSYTYKMYIFQFINYYATLFYLAFVQGNFLGDPGKDTQLTGRCGPAGCSFAVTSQLGMVFILKQIIQNTLEVGKPALSNWLKRRKNVAATAENEYTRWERDFDLQAPESLELFGEYFEMVMQYGFVTMFVAAFPLAPFFALLNNVVEIRIDANKFICETRRLIPERASGIGSWYGILEFVSRLSVLTNALLIAVTTDVVDRLVYIAFYSDGGKLDGYAAWTLSTFHTEDWHNPGLLYQDKMGNVTECLFKGYMMHYTDPVTGGIDYRFSPAWWHVTLCKLGFVLAFEHLIFFTQYVIQYMVPDIPDNVSLHNQRNRHLAKFNAYKTEMQRHEKKKGPGPPGGGGDFGVEQPASMNITAVAPTKPPVAAKPTGIPPPPASQSGAVEPTGPLYGSIDSSERMSRGATPSTPDREVAPPGTSPKAVRRKGKEAKKAKENAKKAKEPDIQQVF